MSVFVHPWLSGLFADPEMAALWSAETQLGHMRAFEAAWSRAGHLAGLWSEAEGAAAAAAIEAAGIDPAALAAGTGRDGVCVPDLVAMLRAGAGDAVHRGATSQDVIDTSLALCMVATCTLIETRLRALEIALGGLIEAHGTQPLMGRTRMQAALEITVADRVNTWARPVAHHLGEVGRLDREVAIVQIGGAVGNRAALGPQADQVVAAVAEDLGLQAGPQWHAQRSTVAKFAGFLAQVSGTLGKMGQDVALMAQMGEITLAGAGGSSAMPHKQNPVLAELLVTLARFNATQISGIHHAMVHEQERSGAAWALEWMLLPQMAEATGRALVAATDLALSIRSIG